MVQDGLYSRGLFNQVAVLDGLVLLQEPKHVLVEDCVVFSVVGVL